MKFIDERCPYGELLYRKISEDGKIEIGVAPMMFGYRIRSGWVGDSGYTLDYCAGDKIEDVEKLYSMVLTIFEVSEKNKKISFPKQIRKPMYNDGDCYLELVELMERHPLIPVSLKNLDQMKSEYIKNIFSENG